MSTTLDQLAARYRESGYSAANGQLYHPNGHAAPAVIRDNGVTYLSRQIAERVEAAQRRDANRAGRRDLRGLVLFTRPLAGIWK